MGLVSHTLSMGKQLVRYEEPSTRPLLEIPTKLEDKRNNYILSIVSWENFGEVFKITRIFATRPVSNA